MKEKRNYAKAALLFLNYLRSVGERGIQIFSRFFFCVFWPSTVKCNASFKPPCPARQLWSGNRRKDLKVNFDPSVCEVPPTSPRPDAVVPSPSRPQPQALRPLLGGNQVLQKQGGTLGERAGRGDQMRQTHCRKLIYTFTFYWIPCE